MSSALALILAACAPVEKKEHKERRLSEAARVNTELGVGYLRRANYELALEKLQKALQYDAQYVDAHTSLAVLYYEIGDTNKAEQHHKQAARIAPDNAEVLNNYGTFLCQTGRFDDAEKYFLQAAQNPFYRTPEVALTNAGRCLIYNKDYNKAELHLRNALQFKPQHSNALLAMAEINFERQDLMQARAFLQRFESSLGHFTPGGLLLGYKIERGLAHMDVAGDYAELLNKNFPNSTECKILKELQNNEPAS